MRKPLAYVKSNSGRLWNPLAYRHDSLARKGPFKCGPDGLLDALTGLRADDQSAECAHAMLTDLIFSEGYPCVGARSALSHRSYWFGVYPGLGTTEAALSLCHDLYEFSHEYAVLEHNFVTFIAVFEGDSPCNELEFEQRLWLQLQNMHDVDAKYFDWDPSVSGDSKAPDFSFSLGCRAYFVVGLHALASRFARQTRQPVLAFNLHELFEKLRDRGQYDKIKNVIRARDQRLQGSVNPVLQTFGEGSEARQYSGRNVSDEWICPFVPHQKKKSVREGPDRFTRIPPQSGTAFIMRRGQVLKVVDPLGKQVADLFALGADNHDIWLSSGRSLDYASKIYLSTGDVLYSNDSRPMFTIVSDTVGFHDFLLTPCSQETFEILYNHRGHHPSCFENLSENLRGFGVDPSRISTTFNIFMNVAIDPLGALTVGVPKSRAGDCVELRAEMDMVCGLTACSAEGSNNGTFKPIDFSCY